MFRRVFFIALNGKMDRYLLSAPNGRRPALRASRAPHRSFCPARPAAMPRFVSLHPAWRRPAAMSALPRPASPRSAPPHRAPPRAPLHSAPPRAAPPRLFRPAPPRPDPSRPPASPFSAPSERLGARHGGAAGLGGVRRSQKADEVIHFEQGGAGGAICREDKRGCSRKFQGV